MPNMPVLLCAYLCSPGRALRIDYAAEAIWLKADGSARDVVDLLVSNKSDEPVDTIYVLYPHGYIDWDAACRVPEDPTRWHSYHQTNDCFFEASETLADRGHALNATYHRLVARVDGEGITNIRATVLDPVTYIRVNYEGWIRGHITVKPYGALSAPERELLSAHGWSMWALHLPVALPPASEPGIAARWIRIAANHPPPHSVPGGSPNFQRPRPLSRLSSDLVWEPEVLGPGLVLRQLELTCERLVGHCQDDPSLQQLLQTATNARDHLDSVLRADCTTLDVGVWAISLFPNAFHTVRQQGVVGDVEGDLTLKCPLRFGRFTRYVPLRYWKATSATFRIQLGAYRAHSLGVTVRWAIRLLPYAISLAALYVALRGG